MSRTHTPADYRARASALRADIERLMTEIKGAPRDWARIREMYQRYAELLDDHEQYFPEGNEAERYNRTYKKIDKFVEDLYP